MEKKAERSIVLLAVLFVFACLLLSGGWRLIGTSCEASPDSVRQQMPVRAAITSMPAPCSELGAAPTRGQIALRFVAAPASENLNLSLCVLCDANGNVLAGKTYLHTVYQAFTLGDGFV
ncbi:MAG: hypothetical protein IJB85_04125 [Clostridia bacterium]|nr:hypothetical protein [Clostridia bacterium]